MADQIRVRLVPKSRTGASLLNHMSVFTPESVADFAPSPQYTREAMAKTADLGIQAFQTPRQAITGFVSKEDFERIFATELVESKPKSAETVKGAIPSAKTFLVPKQEIKLPPSLADTIDFAYVPTPPVYLGIDIVPPRASIYHLQAEDVARVLRAYQCHRQGWTGRGIKIAMVDSGFARHSFFNQYAFNITRISASSFNNPEDDDSGHGTGESANALVIAPDCLFVGIKQNDSSAESLEVALDQNPQIMTNSWGWSVDTQSLANLRNDDPNFYNEVLDIERIVKDAVASNVTVIFSGGNGHFAFPGCLPQVISAGGTTVNADGELSASSYASSFKSQFYPGRNVPDFCGVVGEAGTAPLKGHIMLPVPNGCELEGENMSANQRNKGWGIFSGTSAAAPQIAGVAALMLSVNPNLKPAEIKGILSSTATDVVKGKSAHSESAALGIDLATGNGLVNALGACLRVKQLLTP